MLDHTDGRPDGTGLLIEITTRYVWIADGTEYHPAFVQTLEIEDDDLDDSDGCYLDPVSVALDWVPEPTRDHPASGSRLLSTMRLLGAWSDDQRAEFDRRTAP
jgi:hypothetical protein